MMSDIAQAIQGDPNDPLTRGEFQEAMQLVAWKGDLKQFATKEDLERFATKDDLRQMERQMATDKQKMLQRMAGDKEEILRGLGAAVEIIRDDFAGAFRDDISAIREKQKQHEKRIGRAEEKLNISSA